MRKLLNSLRISTRILLGFILITACIVLVSAMAHWALTTARENFLSFRKASDYALEVTDLERDTLDLQTQASHRGRKQGTKRRKALKIRACSSGD